MAEAVAAAGAAGAAAAEKLKEEEERGRPAWKAPTPSITMTSSIPTRTTNKNPLAAFLAHQRCIVNDGGMGTLLEDLTGGPLDPKLW